MGIYEDIRAVCFEAQNHDSTADEAERVLRWLDSASCPIVPEEELD